MGMFFEQAFSNVGRKTAVQLEILRSQMGKGVDPAIERSKEKAPPPQPDDQSQTPIWCPNTADVESAREKIEELHSRESETQGQGEHRHTKRPTSAALYLRGARASEMMQEKRDRERARPSSAFLARSRQERNRKDSSGQFQAPPVGTYKPNADVCLPRTPSTVPFNAVAARNAPGNQGRPKDCTSEVGDIIERAPPHIQTVDLSKVPSRGDFYKSAGIVYNENSFTEALDTGYLHRSQSERQPSWDFSKLVSHSKQNPESFSEPGLYNVKETSVRPTSASYALNFGTQCGRRPASAPVHAGHVRPSLTDSCPLLSTERRICGVPDFARSTSRPELAPARVDASDGEDASGAQLLEAALKLRPRATPARAFKTSMDRLQHLKSMRKYADDVCLQLTLENLEQGPKSVEFEVDVYDRPCFNRNVATPLFHITPGRVKEAKHFEPSSRQRVPQRSAKFHRPSLQGYDCQKVVRRLRTKSGYEGMTIEEMARALAKPVENTQPDKPLQKKAAKARTAIKFVAFAAEQ